MLSKAIIFVFSFFGIFAILMVTIPTDFLDTSATYQDKAIAERFSDANVTMYANTGGDNMTFPYSSMDDGPSAPDWEVGLPSGQYFEVWWAQYGYAGWSLQFRHTTEVWWGRDTHILTIYERDSITRYPTPSYMLTRARLVDDWDNSINATVVVAKCEHIVSSVMVQYNDSKYTDIGNAWDNGELGYSLSYEIDWNATGVSAWTLIMQLLTFQAPNFGVPGVAGTILNFVIMAPIYAVMAYLIYKLVAGLIPLVSGGGGD